MSVLLCRRAGEFQHRVMAVSGLGPWDKEFPHCVPRTRERRRREPVKMLFHFHVGWASARTGVPSDVPRAPAVQARPEMRSCLRAYPRKQRRASARAVVPSHQAMARGAKRARVLQAGYPAPARIDGNRVSARGMVSGDAGGRWRQGSGWFPFACVAQRYARRQPRHAVQTRSSLRKRKRALHNTQLCSNRLVTEGGPARPRKLPAA